MLRLTSLISRQWDDIRRPFGFSSISRNLRVTVYDDPGSGIKPETWNRDTPKKKFVPKCSVCGRVSDPWSQVPDPSEDRIPDLDLGPDVVKSKYKIENQRILQQAACRLQSALCCVCSPSPVWISPYMSISHVTTAHNTINTVVHINGPGTGFALSLHFLCDRK